MRVSVRIICAAIGAIATIQAQAQSPSRAAQWGLYVYPNEGQSLQQMQLDETECVAWGRDATGVDPNNPAAGVRVARTNQQSSGVGVSAGTGAVSGAAKAGLIGNVAGKSGSEWAAYGAVIGAARGAGRRQAANEQAAAQAQADAEAEVEQRMEQFKNAFSVCMQGRQYTVSGG